MIAKSLRGKLLLAIFLCITVAGVVGGWLTHRLFKSHLYGLSDQELADKLSFFVRNSVQDERNIVSFYMNSHAWERAQDPEDPFYYQFRFSSGKQMSIMRSPSLEGADLPLAPSTSEEPAYMDLTLPSGAPGRAIGGVFTPKMDAAAGGWETDDSGGAPTVEAQPVYGVIARDMTDILTALESLRDLLIKVGATTAVLLLAGSYFLVKRNLRPLRDLSEQIDETPITSEGQTLGGQFHLENAAEELDPVVERLNALMNRVGDAIETERQFTSNAAHELRNPLAGMRAQIELALLRPREPESYRDTLNGVLEIEESMEAAVENLLLLARLQGEQSELKRSEVHLPSLLRNAWRTHESAAEEKTMNVQWDCDDALPPIFAVKDLLEIVAHNFFDNAISYTERGGEISVRIEQSEKDFTFSVSNTNPGMKQDDLDKMFKRFWRADLARSDHSHAGIGLGLCQRISEVLKGKLGATIDGGMIEVSLRVPLDS